MVVSTVFRGPGCPVREENSANFDILNELLSEEFSVTIRHVSICVDDIEKLKTFAHSTLRVT